MPISTSPPPPDPSSTTTSSLLLFPDPRPPNSQPLPLFPPPSTLPPNPNSPQLDPQDPAQLLYSSGRGRGLGLVPALRPGPVTLPIAQLPPRSPFMFPRDSGPVQFLSSKPSSAANGGVCGGRVIPGVVKGIPMSNLLHPKFGSSTSLADSNGHNDLRDRSSDDDLPVIRERKVKASNNASLYTLCGSWLKNGFPEETQPHYMDAINLLPTPLPAALIDSDSPKEKKDKEEEDEFQDEGSVEQLSTKELLQRHIKHSKRVRSRLREQRLRRITRYTARLSLFLPPLTEQTLQK